MNSNVSTQSNNTSVNLQNNNTSKKKIPADDMCINTLEYLKNNDTQKLKELFCDEIKNTHDIDKEIREFYEFIDGNFIEFSDYKFELSDGGEYDKGVYVKYYVADQIRYARTDNDAVYKLNFYANIIQRKEPTKVGLEYIKCTNADGEVKYIGEYID